MFFSDPQRVELWNLFDPKKRVAPEFVLQRKGAALQNLFDPIKIKRVAPEFVRLRKGAAPQNFTESSARFGKQSKQTPFQLWKFCNMKTVTN